MKIIVLTTADHLRVFFVEALQKHFPIAAVVVETESLSAPFETSHPFENERNEYEIATLWKGEVPAMCDVVRTLEVSNINDSKVCALLEEVRPDVVISFGTRKILRRTLAVCPKLVANLHRGDPERYRGLDSHLWQIYHGDFSPLVTTIHRVNDVLDDGEIILQAYQRVEPGMKIHALRSGYAERCVSLTASALAMVSRDGDFVSRPQRCNGRYYSFMPAVLKDVTCAKFKKYVDKL